MKSSRLEYFLVNEYNNKPDFCFVQIGAHNGVNFDNLYEFVTTHRCRGLVVEPIKIYFEELKANYADYPNIIPINLAIHTKKRDRIYHVDPDKLDLLPKWAMGLGSLDPNHHLRTKQIPSEYIITEEVECIDLMSLLKEQDINHINLLQIDTEGYDFEILKMIEFNTIKPAIIRYEHNCLDDIEKLEARQLLEKQGYDIIEEMCDSIAII